MSVKVFVMFLISRFFWTSALFRPYNTMQKPSDCFASERMRNCFSQTPNGGSLTQFFPLKPKMTLIFFQSLQLFCKLTFQEHSLEKSVAFPAQKKLQKIPSFGNLDFPKVLKNKGNFRLQPQKLRGFNSTRWLSQRIAPSGKIDLT